MQSLIHSLNISTMATWLSVAGFGTVGVVVPHYQRPGPVAHPVVETILSDADFTLGEVADAGQPEGGGGSATLPESIETPPESLPSPPDLPELSELAPLPDVPALPAPAPAPAVRRTSVANNANAVRQSVAGARQRQHNRGTTSRGSMVSSSSGGSGSGLSPASRLAAGHMPAPNYPSVCRRMGQSGTVVVEFTVDGSGRVISAHAAKPSPWPLLDHEAVRTVRRWKFPPGNIMKLQRPIVFQLR